MLRSRTLPALTVALGALLAACGDATGPQSPFPPTPTAVSLAPQTMLLRPNQLQGYVRTEDVTVDANSLADQESDPSLTDTLHRDGLQMGARATYSDPSRGTPTPFATVISQVLLFKDEAGATSFYKDETTRRSKAPDGGSIAPLDNLPLGGADAITGLAATVPPQSTTEGPSRALFALIRRGRIVAEVLGGGTAASATDDRFVAIVTAQEQQLAARVES